MIARTRAGRISAAAGAAGVALGMAASRMAQGAAARDAVAYGVLGLPVVLLVGLVLNGLLERGGLLEPGQPAPLRERRRRARLAGLAGAFALLFAVALLLGQAGWVAVAVLFMAAWLAAFLVLVTVDFVRRRPRR